MNSATNGANCCWQALPKRSFHFVSPCRADKTVPNLSTLVSTLKAHHTLMWRRTDNQTSAVAPPESVIPAECWQVPEVSLWNANPLDNVCPPYCLCVVLIVCVDIKLISFQSAAGTYSILQEWNKRRRQILLHWIFCQYTGVNHMVVMNKSMDCFSSNLHITTHFSLFVPDCFSHSCWPSTLFQVD